jgi:hypothetical protein
LLFADPRRISFAFHRAGTPKSKTAQPLGQSNDEIGAQHTKNLRLSSFPQLKLLSTFPIAILSMAMEKIMILCVFCDSNERREWAVKIMHLFNA